MPHIKQFLLPTLLLLLSFSANGKGENVRTGFKQQSSLLFIENKGQITDQGYKVRTDIDAKLETQGLTIFIGDGQLHYQWTKSHKSEVVNRESLSGASGHLPSAEKADTLFKEGMSGGSDQLEWFTPGSFLATPANGGHTASNTETYRMDVTLVGANPNAELTYLDADDYYENYYTANTPENGITAKSYRKMVYKNIYPGIDWVIYTKSKFKSQNQKDNSEQGLKYDFIVHPNGNPKDIQIRYEGATGITLQEGALVATTPFGSITENAPYTYNAGTKELVNSAFKLNDNILSFDIAEYYGTIVIDPQLHWATYYGGSASEHTGMVTTDYGGNVFLAATTRSASNIATTGAYQTTLVHVNNTYLVKFNTDGQRIWSTYYTGNAGEAILALSTDFSGNIFLGGTTNSTAGIATTGAFRDTFVYTNGQYNAFLAKFNNAGQRIWATYYGGERGAVINDIAVDRLGNVYIAGTTISTTTMATIGPTFTTISCCHGFIAKFTNNGQRLWGTYNTSVDQQHLYGITCDDSLNIYVVGIIQNPTNNNVNFPTSGAHQSSYAGNRDGSIAKYSASGALIWSTYYGGSAVEYLFDVVCDNSGNVYVAGETGSSTGIATSGSYQNNLNNSDDGFVAKFTSTGTRVWSTYYGGGGEDRLVDISFNPLNTLYVAGESRSSSGMTTTGALQTTNMGGEDLVFAEFDTSGALLWGTYYGGTERDQNLWGSCIASGSDGHIYFSGSTYGSTGLATSNSFKDTITGGHETILIAFINDTSVYIPLPYIDTSKCAGDTIRVPYNTSYRFSQGNTFTVQLSDANGSYTNAVTIGTHVDTTADTITCVIPANTTTGGDYKIRIVASNPVRTSPENGFRFRISQYPTQPIITTNTPLCNVDTLQLSSINSGTDVSYAWTGPNSFTASIKDTAIANPTVAASGVYILTATRAICSLSDTDTVAVRPMPLKPIATNNGALCAGDTLMLNATSTSTGVTYSWTGPATYTSTKQNDTIGNTSTSMSGNYIVNADLNGCTRKDTTTVLVKPLPSAVTSSTNTPICAGDTLHISIGNSSTGVNYSWAGPNSFTANTRNTYKTNTTTAATGWYVATLSLNGCFYKDSTYATVRPIPAQPAISYNSPLCLGETLNLSTANISGAVYSWTGANNFTSNTQNPTRGNMQFGDTGLYILTTTVNGCVSPQGEVRVALNPTPFVVIFADKDSICQGTPVTFTALPNNAGANPLYQWKVNLQNVASGSASFNTSTLNNGDVVSCDMTDNAKCSTPFTDASNDIQMDVFPWLTPAVSITASPTGLLKPNEYVSFTATVQDAGNSPIYQWKRNGQNVTGATSATWSANTLNDNDSISVEIVSSYRCPQPANAASNGIVVHILTGISQTDSKTALTLYPNPNNGRFVLKGNLPLTKDTILRLEILNTLGQTVHKDKVSNTKGEVFKELQLKDFASGTYLLRLYNNEYRQTILFNIR